MVPKLKFLGYLFLLTPLPAIANPANPSQMEKKCYAAVMENAMSRNYVIVAKTVSPYCGCVVNNYRQGLSVRSCPNWKGVPENIFFEYFE